jgi:hypothetical protein
MEEIMDARLSEVGGQFFLDWPGSEDGVACHIDYLRPAFARLLGFNGSDKQIEAATDYLYQRLGNVILPKWVEVEYN